MPRRMNRECNQVRHDKAHGIQALTANNPGNVALEERAITPERADDAQKAGDSRDGQSRPQGLLPDGFPPVAQHAWLW
jgi:hypothetical protein